MSARNGDKSRFNRERQQKIARRKRNRVLLKRITPPISTTPLGVGAGYQRYRISSRSWRVLDFGR